MKIPVCVALLLMLYACAPEHILPYVPKHREYKVDATVEKTDAVQVDGSLWGKGHPAAMLYTDARALRENDLVVVKVEEVADAKRTSDTDLNRTSNFSTDVSAFLKLAAKNPAFSGGFASNNNTTFQGDGSTARTEHLTATVPALVRKVLPNGNLFIEGHRVVLVNSEEHHFYISGVVRPIDIDQENSIKSSMIADAEIEFTGRGVLSDNQKQGWFSRHLSKFWPF